MPGAVTEMALADWDQALAVNLTGTMLCARAVLPGMVAAGGGAIVTVASIFGMTGGQGNTPYNVSKGGVLQLTRSLAADYGAAGVRVNGCATHRVLSRALAPSRSGYQSFRSPTGREARDGVVHVTSRALSQHFGTGDPTAQQVLRSGPVMPGKSSLGGR